MKKRLLIMASSATLLVAANAYCADGVYVSANAGVAIPSDSSVTDQELPSDLTMDFEYSSGIAAGVAVGYKAGSVRFEAEVEYQETDFDTMAVSYLGANFDVDSSGDLTATSIMANAYYDFPTGTAITPYITAGIGAADLEVNDLAVDVPGYGSAEIGNVDDQVFAYQLGAGLGFAVNDQVTIDLKYRYFATEDPTFEDTTDAEFESHNILAGVRVGF